MTKETKFEQRLRMKLEEAEGLEKIARDDYKLAREQLDLAQSDFNWTNRRNESAKKLALNYANLVEAEADNGTHINNVGLEIPTEEYQRLQELGKERDRESVFKRKYSSDEQSIINHYLKETRDKIRSRSMTEREYEFFKKGSAKKVIFGILEKEGKRTRLSDKIKLASERFLQGASYVNLGMLFNKPGLDFAKNKLFRPKDLNSSLERGACEAGCILGNTPFITGLTSLSGMLYETLSKSPVESLTLSGLNYEYLKYYLPTIAVTNLVSLGYQAYKKFKYQNKERV